MRFDSPDLRKQESDALLIWPSHLGSVFNMADVCTRCVLCYTNITVRWFRKSNRSIFLTMQIMIGRIGVDKSSVWFADLAITAVTFSEGFYILLMRQGALVNQVRGIFNLKQLVFLSWLFLALS